MKKSILLFGITVLSGTIALAQTSTPQPVKPIREEPKSAPVKPGDRGLHKGDERGLHKGDTQGKHKGQHKGEHRGEHKGDDRGQHKGEHRSEPREDSPKK